MIFPSNNQVGLVSCTLACNFRLVFFFFFNKRAIYSHCFYTITIKHKMTTSNTVDKRKKVCVRLTTSPSVRARVSVNSCQAPANLGVLKCHGVMAIEENCPHSQMWNLNERVWSHTQAGPRKSIATWHLCYHEVMEVFWEALRAPIIQYCSQ